MQVRAGELSSWKFDHDTYQHHFTGVNSVTRSQRKDWSVMAKLSSLC